MQRPTTAPETVEEMITDQVPPTPGQILRTPITLVSFHEVRRRLASQLYLHDGQSRLYLEKLANATEKVFADRALLLDENKLLFEQNNEKTTRDFMRVTMVGRAKVMSYDDMVEAQRRRDEKESRRPLAKKSTETPRVATAMMLSSADREALEAQREMDTLGLLQYCHVLDLNGDRWYDGHTVSTYQTRNSLVHFAFHVTAP